MSTCRQFAVKVFLVVAVLGGILASAEEAQAPVPPEETWLGIDIFRASGNPRVTGKENFLLVGTFNLPPQPLDFASTDAVLTIDNWSVTIPEASWTNKGKSKQWKAKVGYVNAQIEYFVAGSSKCKYRFNATNQDLRNNWPSMPELPVRIQIGTVFDEWVIAEVDSSPSSVKLDSVGPSPRAVIDTASIKSSPKLNKDGILVGMRLNLEGFDPAVNGLWMQFGSVAAEILPGELTDAKKGNVIRFKKEIFGVGKLSLMASTKTGKTTIALTNLEMPVIDNPMVMQFQATNLPGAFWRTKIWMSVNKPGTQYRY